jgi:hypothetical protein
VDSSSIDLKGRNSTFNFLIEMESINITLKSNVAAADPAASRRGMFPPPHKAGSSKLIHS